MRAHAERRRAKEKLSRLTGVAVDEQDLRLMGDSLCDEATLATPRACRTASGSSSSCSAAAPTPTRPPAPPRRRSPRRRRRRASAPSPSGGGAAASACSGRIGAELARGAQRARRARGAGDREKVHQEHFTRVLEQLDALDLDGLGDDERAAVRRERKALVLRCERLSAKV